MFSNTSYFICKYDFQGDDCKYNEKCLYHFDCKFKKEINNEKKEEKRPFGTSYPKRHT